MNQQMRILKRLRSKKTVNGYEFAMLDGILQYSARIKELRNKGHIITNTVVWKNGKKHSFFNLEDKND